jgi:hypothetical protein
MDTAAARLAITERIEVFITEFENSGHDPDRWQCLWLSRALNHLKDGDYAHAATALTAAQAAPLKRSPEAMAEISIGYEPAPIADHRANLEQLKGSSRTL